MMTAFAKWISAAAGSIVLFAWVKLAWGAAWLAAAGFATWRWRAAAGRVAARRATSRASASDGSALSASSHDGGDGLDPDFSAAWRLAALNVALIGGASFVGVATAFAAPRLDASGNTIITLGSGLGLGLLGGLLWTWGRGLAYFLRGVKTRGRSAGSTRLLVWLWVTPPVAGVLWFLSAALVAYMAFRGVAW